MRLSPLTVPPHHDDCTRDSVSNHSTCPTGSSVILFASWNNFKMLMAVNRKPVFMILIPIYHLLIVALISQLQDFKNKTINVHRLLLGRSPHTDQTRSPMTGKYLSSLEVIMP